MRFGIKCIGKTLLLLLCVRSVPKESPMFGRQERRMRIDDSKDDHKDEFEDKEDRASLNNEGRFVPRGERHGRGF